MKIVRRGQGHAGPSGKKEVGGTAGFQRTPSAITFETCGGDVLGKKEGTLKSRRGSICTCHRWKRGGEPLEGHWHEMKGETSRFIKKETCMTRGV